MRPFQKIVVGCLKTPEKSKSSENRLRKGSVMSKVEVSQ